MTVAGGMTLAELVEVLEGTGYPVALPGDTDSDVPCLQLVPRGHRHRAGESFLWAEVDVNCTVRLEGVAARYDDLEAMVVSVELALGERNLAIDEEHPIRSDASGRIPVVWETVNVTYPGRSLCP